MAATQEQSPPSHGLVDVLFCYPVVSTLSDELEFDDLINLHLTSKTLYRALHLADFDINHPREATSRPRKPKPKASRAAKDGNAGTSSSDAVDEDSYFQMLLNRAGRLECEIPPPDEAYGGRGTYSRPCSRKVKRCVKCRKGACRYARSFMGTGGNVRKACLDCLNYGTNPWLRMEDRQASLESITHRKVDCDGITVEIVTLKDSRLEHREDLAQNVVTGRCRCLDVTERGSLKRWICWDCEMTERYEVMQYANWERTHPGLCECGCEVFEGILREGAMEPVELEPLPEASASAGDGSGNLEDENQGNEFQAKVNNNNQSVPARRHRRRRKLIGMPRKKSRTAAAINSSGNGSAGSSGSVASRVAAIQAALDNNDASNDNTSTTASTSDSTTAPVVEAPQGPEAQPAALGLCAWCGLRVYGLHQLENDGRSGTDRLVRPAIPGYDTASEPEPDDNENEEEEEQNDEEDEN